MKRVVLRNPGVVIEILFCFGYTPTIPKRRSQPSKNEMFSSIIFPKQWTIRKLTSKREEVTMNNSNTKTEIWL